MSSQRFSLKPFISTGFTERFEIHGTIRLRHHMLGITYNLLGPLREIVFPEPSVLPLRKHSLWVTTCFECFLAPIGSEPYWEFNLSTSGHWNVYSFTSYRQGMQEETAFASLPFLVSKQEDSFQLSLAVDLRRIIPTARTMQAGLGVALQPGNGQMTFWALTHPGEQADFHRRDGFLLELSG